MHKADIERFWKNVDRKRHCDCWEWKASCMRGGYGGFKYYPDQKNRKNRKQISAHIFSYIIAKGDVQKGLNVCHTCDNPKCVNPDHLFLGTHKDNMQDMINKGRGADNRGIKNGRSLLNEEKVREIKKMLKNKTNTEIACIYKVSDATIWQIRAGNNWKFVK